MRVSHANGPSCDRPVSRSLTGGCDPAQGHAYSDSADSGTSSDRDGYKQGQPQKGLHEGAAIGKSADNGNAEDNGYICIPDRLPGAARNIVCLSALDGEVLEEEIPSYLFDVPESSPSIRMALHSQVRGIMDRSKPSLLRGFADGLRFPKYLRIRAIEDKRYSRPLDAIRADVDC